MQRDDDDPTQREEPLGELAPEERQSLARLEQRMFGGGATALRVDRYELGEPLGRGGMGVVYRGWDPELRRKVAIKLVNVADVGSHGAARLLREARAIARISHPNVVPVYDVGDYLADAAPGSDAERRNVFVVMELVEGEDLDAWLAAAPRSWEEVLDAFLAAGHGLAAAHAAGVLHRDFKPANVLRGRDGRVRVADFGLARGIDPVSDGRPRESASDSAHALRLSAGELETQAGIVMGTPYFMAPEQMRGDEADASSDQYAFCVALFGGIYRRGPFPRLPLQALAELKAAGSFEAPADGAGAPQWLSSIIARGLAPDRTRRWPSMHALLQAIEQRRGRRRRRVRATVIGGAIAAAVGIGLAVGRMPAEPVAAVVAAAPVQGPPVLAFQPFEVVDDPRLSWAVDGLPELVEQELRDREGIRVVRYHRLKTALGGSPAAELPEVVAAFGATGLVSGVVAAHGDGYEVTLRLRTPDGEVESEQHRSTDANGLAEAVRELARELAVHVLGHPLEGPAAAPRPTDYAQNLALGVAALERHDLALALGYLDEARRLQPDAVDAHFYGGILAGWLGLEEEARAELELAGAGELSEPKRRYVDANLVQLRDGPAAALPRWREATAAFPREVYLAYGLFECLYHGGDGAGAVAEFRRLHALSPGFGSGLSHVLDRAAAIEDLPTVDWALDAAAGAEQAPQFLAFWRARRRGLERDYRGALELLSPFAEDDGYAFVQALGWHAAAGDYALALARVRQRTDRDPSFDPLHELGLCTARGDAACGRASFERARAGLLRGALTNSSSMSWISLATLESIGGDRTRLLELERLREHAVEASLRRDVRFEIASVLLTAALEGPAAAATPTSDFAPVREVAAAFAAEAKGNPKAAAAHWHEVAALALDARFIFAAHFHRARMLHEAGDHDGVLAACRPIVEPRNFDWSWAAAISPCLVFSGEAARARGDADAARGFFERVPAVRAMASADDPWLARARAKP